MAERRKAEDIIKSYDEGGTTTLAAPASKPTAKDIIKRYDEADDEAAAAAAKAPWQPAVDPYSGAVSGEIPPADALGRYGDWGAITRARRAVVDHFTTPPPSEGSVGRVLGAAVKGARQSGNFFEPETHALVDQTTLGRFIYNPFLDAASGVMGGLSGALSQGAMEVGDALGGGLKLGRDINALMAVAPVHGAMPGVYGPGGASVGNALKFWTETDAPRPPAYEPQAFPPMTRAEHVDSFMSSLTPEEAAKWAETSPEGKAWLKRQGADEGAPAADEGGAVGADVTRTPIPEKTRTERIVGLQKAVEQTAEERAGPQLVDEHPYVPDIPPRLLAGRDFSTSLNALDEKVASARDPAFKDAIDANKRKRNEGMVEYLRDSAGDPTALDLAHEERAKLSPDALGVFKDEKPADASSLVADIDRLLNGPEGKQKAVRNTLNSVREELFDRDGNLETLPSRIYGARKNLTDLLKRGVKGTGDMADDVRAAGHHLKGLLPAFDETISSGSPGFSEYLKGWSEASKPINQMDFMQKYFSGAKKITGDDGYLKPAKVQKMLDDILQEHKKTGNTDAQSLTDEQINRVEAVRNELAAQQLQDRLAGVRGSDTFQQLEHRFGGEGAIGNALRTAADVAGTVTMPGLYNYVLKPGFHANRERNIRIKTETRKNQLLQPPAGDAP